MVAERIRPAPGRDRGEEDDSRAIVYPEQVAMYLAKHMAEASLPEISRQIRAASITLPCAAVEKIEELRREQRRGEN